MLDAIKSPEEVEDRNFISVVDFTVIERLNNCCNKEEINTITFEELQDKGAKTTNIAWSGEKQPVRIDRHFELLDLSNKEVKPFVSFIEVPHILELKLLPSHLKYVYLGNNGTLLVIISSSLNADQEKSLVNVLGSYKKAIAWTMADIKGLALLYACTRFCWKTAIAILWSNRED